MLCPRCQSPDCRYSQRRVWERWISKVMLRRPMRCRACRKRFWVSLHVELRSGFEVWRHLGWFLSLALVLALSALYIDNLPYQKEQARRPGERPVVKESVGVGASLEEQSTFRRLSAVQLTPLLDGLQLTLLGAAPLEHSALRHFQVPDRIVLDLAGPWDPPAPSTEGLQHPLLDRVRLVERGAGLRLELLLRVTEVEASLQETEEGLVVTVRRSSVVEE